MTKNQKITAVSLIAVGLIVLVPLFALRGAEFGGSDDAGSQMVEQIQGESYEPGSPPCWSRCWAESCPARWRASFSACRPVSA